ncbi:MAG TPA: hypothetical protein VI685_18845 [Candidatus Angelobacter sp.]
MSILLNQPRDLQTSQPRTAKISFPPGDEEELLVLPLGGNMYRLEESSMLAEARYHDIIEAEAISDGTLRFVRVAAPSNLKTVSCTLPDAEFESPALSALLDRVMAAGGNWERVFGGVLLLHLPAGEEGAVLDQLKGLTKNP